MLPFLMPKKVGSALAVISVSDGTESQDDSLQSIAGDLIAAVHSKDAKAVAAALEAAFYACDAEPHDEGEQI